MGTTATLREDTKPDLELALRHDGRRWTACAGTMRVSGRTLSEFEARLHGRLRERYPPHARVIVHLGFDTATMPLWLREYMAHHFNRLVIFDL